jgi:hypothetical protein
MVKVDNCYLLGLTVQEKRTTNAQSFLFKSKTFGQGETNFADTVFPHIVAAATILF